MLVLQICNGERNVTKWRRKLELFFSVRKRLLQTLNDKNVPANQIIRTSAHKNVNSINRYSHSISWQAKQISNIRWICSAVPVWPPQTAPVASNSMVHVVGSPEASLWAATITGTSVLTLAIRNPSQWDSPKCSSWGNLMKHRHYWNPLSPDHLNEFMLSLAVKVTDITVKFSTVNTHCAQNYISIFVYASWTFTHNMASWPVPLNWKLLRHDSVYYFETNLFFIYNLMWNNYKIVSKFEIKLLFYRLFHAVELKTLVRISTIFKRLLIWWYATIEAPNRVIYETLE